jgi:hypothetical protein
VYSWTTPDLVKTAFIHSTRHGCNQSVSSHSNEASRNEPTMDKIRAGTIERCRCRHSSCQQTIRVKLDTVSLSIKQCTSVARSWQR